MVSATPGWVPERKEGVARLEFRHPPRSQLRCPDAILVLGFRATSNTVGENRASVRLPRWDLAEAELGRRSVVQTRGVNFLIPEMIRAHGDLLDRH